MDQKLKQSNQLEKLKAESLPGKLGQMVLVMIQYLFQITKKITFGEMKSKEKYKIDHRFRAFKKIKKFL